MRVFILCAGAPARYYFAYAAVDTRRLLITLLPVDMLRCYHDDIKHARVMLITIEHRYTRSCRVARIITH